MAKWNWRGPGAQLALNYTPLMLWFSAIAISQISNQHHHPPESAEEYAAVLEDPGRDAWQKPMEVVLAMKLGASDVVADIGAGTGYFARRFAHHAAKVYAVDIDSKLLDIVAKSAPPNLITVLAKPDNPSLAPASVDVIFFCDVLHHLADRPAYFQHLKAALKPGGRVVTVDFYKKDLPVGPPDSMKLSEETIVAEFAAAPASISVAGRRSCLISISLSSSCERWCIQRGVPDQQSRRGCRAAGKPCRHSKSCSASGHGSSP
jgi:SAM-dependent methyltransferase